MKTSNVTVIAAAMFASITMLAVALIVAFAPADADLGLLIGLLVTAAGNLVATIVTVGRTDQIKGTVDDLANGKMDAKIRAGVADVLKDHLIDPTTREQIAQDRIVRDDH